MFLYAVGGSLIMQMLVIYFPPFQAIFQTESISFLDILTLLAIASTVLLQDEIRKTIRRYRKQRKQRYQKLAAEDLV